MRFGSSGRVGVREPMHNPRLPGEGSGPERPAHPQRHLARLIAFVPGWLRG